MRKSARFTTDDIQIKQRLLSWAAKHKTVCVLNSNRDQQLFSDAYSRFDFMMAVDAIEEIQINGNSFDSLKNFHQSKNDWLFGFLTYDLKNEIENLVSENHDGIEFPGIHFFQPRLILRANVGSAELEILYLESHDTEVSIRQVLDEILTTEIPEEEALKISIQQKIPKEEYISTVKRIKNHIQLGDIYEMNYCTEYFAEKTDLSPVKIYEQLNEASPTPFSSFYRVNNHYLACASPERFLAKRKNKIVSQPIKGTAKRGKTAEEDLQIKLHLKADAKEQSENVMIVDLVRNDLSRIAAKATVAVEELFGIYTFTQLHHMISTVVCEKRDDLHFTEVIKQCFPMGSMTGAPKIRAMQLIEEFENTKRGLFSGCIGYITPGGDFDFNVVIRSILYNAEKKYLSFMVGSAITANSVPEKEYEECLLKANALLKVLSSYHPATVNE
jgi:para-aminobenzoate synthetase component 1